MELAVLSRFNMQMGPQVFLVAPESHSFEELDEISNLMDLYDEGFFIHMTDNFKSANIIFHLPSEYARGNKETLEISLVIDAKSDINLNSIRNLLEEFIDRLSSINACYKGFYVKSQKHQGDETRLALLKDKFLSFHQSVTPVIKELKEADNKLKESEKQYRELVENVNSIILKWDFNGKVLFINTYGENFFNYNRDELIGKDVIGNIVAESETSGRDLKELIDNIKSEPDKYAQNINENVTRDGKKAWISWTNRGLRDLNSNIIGILSVGNDITHLKNSKQTIIS